MQRWRRQIACGVVLILGLGAVATASTPGSPSQVVEQTVQQVLAVLALKDLEDADRRRRLEEIVYARFDFSTMGRLVLARNWRQFSVDQKKDFLEEYRRYLANSYGARLNRYSGEQVQILGQREEPRGDVTVQTKIVGGEYDGALVDYRMRSGEGKPWLVIDVIIEGVSLVSNYRDQFKEVLSQGGPNHLLEKLREKNASGETDAPA